MLNQVRKTIKSHAMLECGDRLVVAVSGGPDSVALLRVLALLMGEFQLCLTAAHLNHGIREAEADGDERFVRDLSDRMGIACICKKMDIRALPGSKGRSLEDLCRDERYRFLHETAEQCGAAKIAIGHHREDQAETVLNHLIRGSGTAGLRGMLPVREGRIIRPLLEVGRAEILEFLRSEGAAFVTDSSNVSPLFLRNRIRNELIPELAARYNPQLIGALCQTARIIRREDDCLQGIVAGIIDRWGIVPGGETVLPLADFAALHDALQGRIVKHLLEAMAPRRNGIGYRHIEAALALARRAGGRSASLDLPFGILIRREGGIIRIAKKSQERKAVPRFEYPLTVPATIHLEEIDRTIRLEWTEKPLGEEMKRRPEIAFMDYDCIAPPLVLRNMRPGDRMEPLGMGGTKKLKDYFIDRKIAARRRSGIPLLVDAASILWIAGERISERVRVTGGTKKVLKAEIIGGDMFRKPEGIGTSPWKSEKI